MSPAGLDGFFRDTCNPPGVPPKQLTREQIRKLAHRVCFSNPVRNTHLIKRTREDLPGRSGVRQTKFFWRLNSTGKPVTVELTCPLSPWKRDRSSEWTFDEIRENASD
jgi:hypothetical protein